MRFAFAALLAMTTVALVIPPSNLLHPSWPFQQNKSKLIMPLTTNRPLLLPTLARRRAASKPLPRRATQHQPRRLRLPLTARTSGPGRPRLLPLVSCLAEWALLSTCEKRKRMSSLRLRSPLMLRAV
ncbi:uncharacterized protein BDZ83DRAFT_245900 [Colletotrichum acutatum]|uniref:Uncharacterized protein n=1 Tax=Glomerella acutata TaxID=27357 RepID=A0AAD8XPT6_GLOAC|nr:uncharacterized protein BDZ83DRAFT_245900 [Colletotrichum acutatum]KAK1731325.1 hypothetical protein BDZ83DRAFT_245900 [Colletotrichum acutatum]